MNEPKMIYLVTAGDHDDYTVVCAFDEDHKADADKLANLGNRGRGEDGDWRVEPLELNTLTPVTRENMLVFMVRGNRDGEITEWDVFTPNESDTKYAELSTTVFDAPWLNGWYTQMLAKDADHACEIARTRWAQMKAEEEGTNKQQLAQDDPG